MTSIPETYSTTALLSFAPDSKYIGIFFVPVDIISPIPIIPNGREPSDSNPILQSVTKIMTSTITGNTRLGIPSGNIWASISSILFISSIKLFLYFPVPPSTTSPSG